MIFLYHEESFVKTDYPDCDHHSHGHQFGTVRTVVLFLSREGGEGASPSLLPLFFGLQDRLEGTSRSSFARLLPTGRKKPHSATALQAFSSNSVRIGGYLQTSSVLFFGAKKRTKRNIHLPPTPPYMEGLKLVVAHTQLPPVFWYGGTTPCFLTPPTLNAGRRQSSLFPYGKRLAV